LLIIFGEEIDANDEFASLYSENKEKMIFFEHMRGIEGVRGRQTHRGRDRQR
jgi:hypothetical protein